MGHTMKIGRKVVDERFRGEKKKEGKMMIYLVNKVRRILVEEVEEEVGQRKSG